MLQRPCTGPDPLEMPERRLKLDLISTSLVAELDDSSPSFSSSFLVVEHVDEACISPEGVDGADDHTCNRRMHH